MKEVSTEYRKINHGYSHATTVDINIPADQGCWPVLVSYYKELGVEWDGEEYGMMR